METMAVSPLSGDAASFSTGRPVLARKRPVSPVEGLHSGAVGELAVETAKALQPFPDGAMRMRPAAWTIPANGA
jgi:hypothetical protein